MLPTERVDFEAPRGRECINHRLMKFVSYSLKVTIVSTRKQGKTGRFCNAPMQINSTIAVKRT